MDVVHNQIGDFHRSTKWYGTLVTNRYHSKDMMSSIQSDGTSLLNKVKINSLKRLIG